LTKEEAAYIAGFLDGESHMTICIVRQNKSARHLGTGLGIRPIIAASQNVRRQQVVYWLKEKLGGCVTYDQRLHDSRWMIGGRRAVGPILETLLPMLICKRDVAMVLLEVCNRRLSFVRNTPEDWIWFIDKAIQVRMINSEFSPVRLQKTLDNLAGLKSEVFARYSSAGKYTISQLPTTTHTLPME
jgi:hypothetical protein